jgi:uncharacterized protein YrrD
LEKYIDIKGKNVVDNYNNIIGSIDSILIDEKLLKVKSLIVCNMMLVKNFYIIPLKCMKTFREPLRFDRTIYKVKKSMLIKNKNIVFKNYLDIEIVDNAGRKMGKLIDCIFEANSGKIKALVASGGFFEDMFEGRKIIMVNENTRFDLKKIIVDECCFEIKNEVYFKKYLKE